MKEGACFTLPHSGGSVHAEWHMSWCLAIREVPSLQEVCVETPNSLMRLSGGNVEVVM